MENKREIIHLAEKINDETKKLIHDYERIKAQVEQFGIEQNKLLSDQEDLVTLIKGSLDCSISDTDCVEIQVANRSDSEKEKDPTLEQQKNLKEPSNPSCSEMSSDIRLKNIPEETSDKYAPKWMKNIESEEIKEVEQLEDKVFHVEKVMWNKDDDGCLKSAKILLNNMAQDLPGNNDMMELSNFNESFKIVGVIQRSVGFKVIEVTLKFKGSIPAPVDRMNDAYRLKYLFNNTKYRHMRTGVQKLYQKHENKLYQLLQENIIPPPCNR